MKCKEYVGRYVKLARKDIVTVEGVIFPKGLIVKVTGTYRGKYTITKLGDPARSHDGIIGSRCSGVSSNNFELLSEDPAEEALLAMKVAFEVAYSLGLYCTVRGHDGRVLAFQATDIEFKKEEGS